MQLTIRQLTQLLDCSESTVSRWIKRRGLPARQVAGQYRVNRSELLEWATANGVKVALELFDHFEVEGDAVPSLVEALEAGGIHYDVQDTNKEQAIRALVQLLPLPDGIDREFLLRLFLAREASAPTAIGDGIAIPHVRNPIVLQVEKPTITLAILRQPVDFGALDGQPVHVLFSLITPTMHLHLQILSRLSFALHDAEFRQAVSTSAPRETIFAALRKIESKIAAPGVTA